ncbi:cupin domain-containing protein [Planctomicrobium piriforme]|uniref:Cupin domain-containing protein n=1 Tax=Planctomicrobium piriforme TaxID=1576369 RepID=A0A1I3P8D6_9PLAN|nr:cupin domain-containing protein [Planctomicrobium piriforme]SFJ17808.1 Cupin domain-containing protein [Planctomicrobium piriforme]
MATGGSYHVVDFNEIAPVPCPCGVSRRAFADVPDYPATIHLTDITLDAQTHYHLRQTEAYYILECDPGAALEMNGELIPLKPGMCVLIPPGVRHRGVGQMRILNIVIPKFDVEDEYLD